MLKELPCMDVFAGMSGESQTITVVSGLPRSGTSMMMRVLAFGGLQVLADHHRQKDASNPHGYFEFEPVKQIGRYTEWTGLAEGKAVKLVSRFLRHLPATHRYKVIFMHRDIHAVLRSQRLMAKSYSGTQWDDDSASRLTGVYQQHVMDALAWAAERPNVELIELHYEAILAAPRQELSRLVHFLAPRPTDLEAMVDAVDSSLNHESRIKEPLHG